MSTLGDPGRNAATVTPSDSTVLNARALYIGGTGDLAVIPIGNSSPVTFVGVPAGVVLPLQVTKVMATNTTATDIVAIS